MSALAVLYLVLPFPLALFIHHAEEIIMQHQQKRVLLLIALVELGVLLLATAYVFLRGPWAMEIWSALFMAFSVHLLVHLIQTIKAQHYTPGVITSVLLLPFAAYGLWSILLVMSWTEVLAWGTAGVLFMTMSRKFLAHLCPIPRRTSYLPRCTSTQECHTTRNT